MLLDKFYPDVYSYKKNKDIEVKSLKKNIAGYIIKYSDGLEDKVEEWNF